MEGLLAIALGIAVVALGAFVRGYSGMGFAMIGVAGLSLIAAPDVAVPVVLILEVIVGLILLPPVWRQIGWRPVLTLLAGAVLLTPVGALFLLSVPADVARLAIAVVIAAAALLLLRSDGTRPAPGRPATLGIGAVSGLLNGAFGISGPPIALFFLGTERGAAVSRASMMACFLVLDAVAVASFGAGGLIDRDVLIAVAISLPALAIGSYLGHRAFHGSDISRFRVRVLWLLVALAAITGARGAWEILG